MKWRSERKKNGDDRSGSNDTYCIQTRKKPSTVLSNFTSMAEGRGKNIEGFGAAIGSVNQ